MIKSNKSDNLRVSIGESLMSSVHMWVVQSPMVRKILGSWGWRCKVLTGPKWASNWDMIRSATILARRLQLKTIPDSHVRVYFILKNHFLSIPSIKNSKFYLVGSRPGICWASKDRIPYNRPIRRNRDFVRDPGTWHRWAHSTSAYPTTKPNRTVSVWCCKTNAAKQMLQNKCCKKNAAKQMLQNKCCKTNTAKEMRQLKYTRGIPVHQEQWKRTRRRPSNCSISTNGRSHGDRRRWASIRRDRVLYGRPKWRCIR